MSNKRLNKYLLLIIIYKILYYVKYYYSAYNIILIFETNITSYIFIDIYVELITS